MFRPVPHIFSLGANDSMLPLAKYGVNNPLTPARFQLAERSSAPSAYQLIIELGLVLVRTVTFVDIETQHGVSFLRLQVTDSIRGRTHSFGP